MSTANLNAKNGEDEKLWEAYNNLLISKDIGRLQKLNIRYDIFRETLNVPGSIVECGVFKGAGLMHWLKLLKILPHEKKTVFGFDTFSFSNELEDYEKETAKSFINEAEFMGVDKENLNNFIIWI